MTVVHRAESPHSCDMWTTPGKPARASACVSCQSWRRACMRPEWPSATATAIWRADSRCSKYLREDELGRSRIISDLLDPDAEHGQGTKFLEAMLGVFPETRRRFGALRPTGTSPIRVVTERWTTTGGRIDITVDIPSATGRFCLAFENKPYAHDLPGAN